ncbi:hypothetical protein D3C87_2143830 [compost metagenome]
MDLMQLFRGELQRSQALFEEGARFGKIERQGGAIKLYQLSAQAQPTKTQRRADAG